MKRVVVIGAGIGGISAAAFLARAGCSVTVFERNDRVGGRARSVRYGQYRFDSGPAWYGMPAEHDRWFAAMDTDRTAWYATDRIDPTSRVCFADQTTVDLPTDPAGLGELFSGYEAGGREGLERFLQLSKVKYEVWLRSLCHSYYTSLSDLLRGDVLASLGRLNLLQGYVGMVRRAVSHPRLRVMLELPTLFPDVSRRIPAAWALVAYARLVLGTWYPSGGIGVVADTMRAVAEDHGVRFELGTTVRKIHGRSGRVAGVQIEQEGVTENVIADAIVANSEPADVETELLDERYQSRGARRSARHRSARADLPVFRLGVPRRVPAFAHHTFFAGLPLYLSAPSRTDPGCAPNGCEAVTIVAPAASGNAASRRAEPTEDGATAGGAVSHPSLSPILELIERQTGESLADATLLAVDRASWYGSPPARRVTPWLPPANRSTRITGLYYASRYTGPDPGITMDMISGRLAAMRITDER